MWRLKRRWIVICVLFFVLAFVAVMLCWNYYRTNYVNKSYTGCGKVVGYERLDDGLIVQLEVQKKPYWCTKQEKKQHQNTDRQRF